MSTNDNELDKIASAIAANNKSDMPTPPHGSRRPRAGRRISDNPMRRYAIMLPDDLAEKAIRMGDGDNMSKGIRKAIDQARED